MLTVKGGQIWCRLTPLLAGPAGDTPEMARVQEEAAVAAGSVETLTPDLGLVT